MYIPLHSHRRLRGAAILEFSLAFPILIILTLGTCVLALGISQYQMVAAMAREGSRWASVRGAQYQATTGNQAASATDVYNQAILPLANGIPASDLSSQVTWSPNNQPGSTLSVTVTYHWVPTAYLGAIDLSSTSVVSVSY